MTVGLTGNIGSGKTVVARILSLLGCAVFDSDSEAKRAYFDADVKPAVTALLGEQAYVDNCTINREYIAGVFADAGMVKQLNGIIHPAVGRRFKAFVREHENQVVVKESALLFEAGLDKTVDAVIVVSAPPELRMKRVMLRTGGTADQVLKRMRHQMPEDDKIAKADVVIHNDETQLVIPQVIAALERLKKKPHA